MIIIKMIQLTPHTWQIRSAKGHIIMPLVIAHSVYEATQYIENYLTSFQNWHYEMVLTENKAKVYKK